MSPEPHNPESNAVAGPEEIARAVGILRAGGLVAFPTETVYGLGADALSAAAIGEVFRLKGRPADNPLIVHVSGEEMARRVASDWPDDARRLARAFWPGPLTIVVPRSPGLPPAVTAGGPTVAVRCPDHHVTLSLLHAFGAPLVGPSANPSGRVSPTTASHVREGFPDLFVLEGGPCRGGIESTVIRVAPAAGILRPGLVSAEEISIVLGHPVEEPTSGAGAAPTEPLSSPGLLPVHYAPQSRAILFDAADLSRILASVSPVAILTHSGLIAPRPPRLFAMPADPAAYAARLYAALREADARRPALIAVERPPRTHPLWDAIADRLSRAATPFQP